MKSINNLTCFQILYKSSYIRSMFFRTYSELGMTVRLFSSTQPGFELNRSVSKIQV